MSAVFGAASIYSVYTSKYILAGIFYFISYSFDCFDGNFARTYNQVTIFGDLFDHIKDWLVIAGLIAVIYSKKEIPTDFKITALVFLIIFIVLCQYHMSCQEDHYHSNNFVQLKSGTIDFFGKNFTHMCTNEKIKYTRYVGAGTLTLYIVIVLISMQLFQNQTHPKNH